MRMLARVVCKGSVEAVDLRLVHFALSLGGHRSLAFLSLFLPLRVFHRLRPRGLVPACVCGCEGAYEVGLASVLLRSVLVPIDGKSSTIIDVLCCLKAHGQILAHHRIEMPENGW